MEDIIQYKGYKMRADHFVQQIEIHNFKCFERLQVQGFGQVNLIGGDNNIGKTAFMETCYLNGMAKDIGSFLGALANIVTFERMHRGV